MCGGNYTGSQGFISSGNQFNYHHNANCTWNITVSPNRIVGLVFTEFNLELGSRCIFDSVELLDGLGENATSISGKLCGNINNINRYFKSLGNSLFIRFKTDGSIARAGFKAEFFETIGPDQGCGGVIRESSRVISSPVITGLIKPVRCEWQVYVTENMLINISRVNFTVRNTANCSDRYLKIFDGVSQSSLQLTELCNSSSSSSLTSSDNKIRILFTTGIDNPATFSLQLTEYPRLCGGFFNATDEPQVISAPSIQTSQAMRCQWVIDVGSSAARQRQNVEVTFNQLNLRSSANCVSSYLQVSDWPTSNTRNYHHYCGQNIPRPFTSRGSQAMILYNKIAGLPTDSFSLSYRVASCNKNYTGAGGRATSPNFPENYHSNQDCTVTISAPNGTMLSLYLTKFHLEGGSTCRYDYLRVSNSTDQVVQLCGMRSSPIFLTDNVATLRYKTDYSLQRPGYDITYVAR